MAFDLVDGYQQLLQETLEESGLPTDDVVHVLGHMQDIGVDNRLLFSLNRKYAVSEEPFDAFCRRHLSEHLLRAVHLSAPEGKRIERLYAHQAAGIRSIVGDVDTVVATGTGSGKTETFLFPLLDHCLSHPGEGVKALIVYPMNALANDQLRRLGDLVGAARSEGAATRYGSFTGLTPRNDADSTRSNPPAYPLSDGHVLYRDDIRRDPPDILITNYVMLDRMLTSEADRSIFDRSADTLRYVVLDELHTYRGNNATHLRGLLRRLRHALHRRPVFVGTSATLTSGGPSTQDALSEGYLTKTPQEEIDAFVKPLFDTDEYVVVTPAYAPAALASEVVSVPRVEDAGALGWELHLDERRGLSNLSRLLGTRFDEFDLKEEDGESPRVTQALERDAFVAELKRRLYQGPLTFREVVDVLRPLAPADTASAVELAKAYLSAIAFTNQKAKGDPVLDFRIHLFLKDLGGHLQMCPRCRRYHSGAQEVCGTCGWPLFKVHKANVREALGKVSGHELRRTLSTQPGDPDMTYLVRIALQEDAEGGSVASDEPTADPDRLQFDRDAPATVTGIPLSYASGGGLELRLLPRGVYEKHGDRTIPLVKARKTYQYLAKVIETLLRSQSLEDRKLLAFIDNREKASRYEAILRDEFASSFYEDLVSLYRPELQMRDLPGAVEFIMRTWGARTSTESEKDLLDEFPAWVSRAVSRSPRKGLDARHGGLFQIQPPPPLDPSVLDSLCELQRDVLSVFFDERAIDKRFLRERVPDLVAGAELNRKRNFLRYQRAFIGYHHGVQLGGVKSLKQFGTTSLGPQTRTYKALIDEHGADAVRDAAVSLVDDGTNPRLPLVAYPVPGGEEGDIHLYLKSSWIRFSPRDKGSTTYADVRAGLLSGELHSSDVLDDRRADAETRFQNGELDLLIATPTLEMGVDIGQLKSVLHIGVPPLPSNYAQRAGRAGRGRSDRYALITTFCSEHSNHDSYYFDRPVEMVAGYISPPAFDPNNEDVLRKHVHALVLRDWIDDGDSFQALTGRADELLPSLAAEAHQVFGDAFDAAGYVLGPLKELLPEWATKMDRARAGTRPVQLFYDINVFPDYGFRRDEVVVIDKKAADDAGEDLQGAARRFLDGVLDRTDQQVLDRYRVSGRDPEQAYYRLFPGETVSMAGDDFGIGSDSPFYDTIGEQGNVRSYRVLYGYRSDDLNKDGEIQQRERAAWVTPDPVASPFDLEGLIQVTHHARCTLSLRTLSEATNTETDSGRVEGDQDAPLTMGYDLEREALTVSLPRSLFADDRLAISFLSAFDRAVKDVYGLDEGDLRLLVDVPVSTEPADSDRPSDSSGGERGAPAFPQPDETLHAILYDASGNGNAPLARVAEELLAPEGALRWAYRRLSNCPNEDCERGCYLCVRSYSTHFYAGDVDRDAACMVVGYLLGENRFEPALPLPPDLGGHAASTVITIGLKGGVATAYAGDHPIAAIDTSQGQNDSLYAAIAKGAAAAFTEDSQGLRVVVDRSVSYLTDLINGRRVGRKARRPEMEAFERMLFSTLRYPSVRAVDHASL